MDKVLSGLSLFSNVGVAEAYLEEIGVDIKIANEIDQKRGEFYKYLYPKTNVIIGDITDNSIRNEIVNESINQDIDFIIATPPCQGMSIAGKMNPHDLRNQLISYAIDVVKRVKPKFILLENVPRQLKTKIDYNGDRILIPEYIRLELEDQYNFNSNPVMSAMDYGVPQMRKRSIFLMSRKDTTITWDAPEKSEKIITLRDAIGHLPEIDPVIREGYETTLEYFPDFEEKKAKALEISKWHYPPTHALRHIKWMMHTPSGETAFNNKIYYPKKANGDRIKGHYNNYRRFDWDKPSRTITQNNGVISSLTCVHPGRLIQDDGTEEGRIYSDPRCLSIYEILIVTSLPKDWNIPPWANDRMIRSVIGEGIPPLLVKRIMEGLLKEL
ncbi:DNA cytosine methyltransferase [Dethiothermospora halolimnae]|uniref:DNA cytosine methyltransferase n=1 Tax=Dethiothermospora halolimnae TaxID=3114390 RepID=UPI003CCBD4E1